MQQQSKLLGGMNGGIDNNISMYPYKPGTSTFDLDMDYDNESAS